MNNPLTDFTNQPDTYFRVTTAAAYLTFSCFVLLIIVLVIVSTLARNLREMRNAIALLHYSTLSACKVRPPDLLPGQTMRVDDEPTSGNTRH